MPKRVWVLGAGASKDMGYPLGADMLQELDQQLMDFMRETMPSPELDTLGNQFETPITNDQRQQIENKIKSYIESRLDSHADGPLLRGLWVVLRIALAKAIEKIYGHRILAKIDFEDFMSRLRLLREGLFPDLFREESERYPGYLENLNEHLFRLLHWLGMRLAQKIDLNSKAWKIYQKFAEAIDPQNDTVISFNQDGLIQVALFRRGIAAILPHPGFNPNDYRAKNTAVVITPHGSFNWVYATPQDIDNRILSMQNRLLAFENTSVAVYQVSELSLEQLPGERRVDLPRLCCIMPPDAFKGISQNPIEPEFIEFYNQAKAELESATQVIIIGFSCRPTDFPASMLLDLGLRGKKADQVIVIDPSVKVPEGISKNIKEFSYIQKGFHPWIAEGGLESLNGRV